MKKLRVLQFEGLAPSVFCGQYFADQGAQVVIIARHQQPPFGVPIDANMMNRNKKCICLSLKSNNDIEIIKQLIKQTDIIIDSFRPGVLEKAKIGPKEIHTINKKAIILRVTGYGQQGSLAEKPGHDLNYISISGFLSQINSPRKPSFPNNYLADFAAAFLGVMGTMAALIQRDITQQGQVVDCSLMHGTRYLSSFLNEFSPNNNIQIIKDVSGKQITKYKNQQGKIIEIKVLQMKQLINSLGFVDYLKQKFILKSTNSLGYSINNPFNSNIINLKTPQRGQHTLSYLQQRNIDKDLIIKSMQRQSKL